MNPELQKSLQVTSLPTTLDSHVFVIFLIMIAAGILGGVSNYFLSDRQKDSTRSHWGKYPVLGVIDALTVPLFLNMISSILLGAARSRPSNFFVFAGFCPINMVASRRYWRTRPTGCYIRWFK